MNRPTISTPSPWRGSNIICANTKARLLPLRMIVIFLITLPVGFSNWIAVTEFHGKAIILRGWNKSKIGSHSKRKAKPSGKKLWQRELEWIRMSPKARQAKGQARVTAYENLLSQESEARREDLEIYIPPGPRLGDIVFEFDKVKKSFDDRTHPR